MLDFRTQADPETGVETVELSLAALALLDCPMFNKGSAFPEEERAAFGLLGVLPPHVGSIDEQLERRYRDFQQKRTELQQHIYLRDLQDRNEVLFYRLMSDHIAEMMPLIYTPVVGEACQHFSKIYRKPRGLFLSYEHRHEIDTILENRPYRDVDVIVVTDGERILGLGDLGVGGMGIPVGKLALYTLCGGVHPARTLPIFLDAGTDNEEALADPLYLGARHPRVRGDQYDDFIERFVDSVNRVLPGTLLQWEDFALPNARRLLERYRNRICSFNDDIQGTAAVSLAAILAASRASGIPLKDQRVVILGAGSAGTGIADQITRALIAEGLTPGESAERIWLVDRPGLLHSGMTGLLPSQVPYARPLASVEGWTSESGRGILLDEVVRQVHPTTLIGVSGTPGTFTRELVQEMARHVERPAIFPLSNPNSRCEAAPADLIAWTEGRALVATGSPFPAVAYQGKVHIIGQCNNAYIFPGLGQGVIASQTTRVTDELFLAAARALAGAAPAQAEVGGSLFPPLEQITQVSRTIALAVAREALRQDLTRLAPSTDLTRQVDSRWWHPHYPRLRRIQQDKHRTT